MSAPYSDVIREHARHPRNYGALAAPDIRHEDVNPLCGDRVRIEVALARDGTVAEARFQGDLCAIAKASASVLTELIRWRTPGDVTEDELFEALHADIPPARRKCVQLPLEVLQAGIRRRATR